MDGYLRYHYNWFDTKRYSIVSNKKVPTGSVRLECKFINETDVPGGPAKVELFIDGEMVGVGSIDKQVVSRFGIESLDIGMDTLTAVDKAYASKKPFSFSGDIKKIRILLGEAVDISPEEKIKQYVAME